MILEFEKILNSEGVFVCESFCRVVFWVGKWGRCLNDFVNLGDLCIC